MRKYAIILLALLLSSLSAITISTEIPAVYEQDSEFVVRITSGFEEAETADFFYRSDGQQGYVQIEMEKGFASNPVFTVQIPSQKEFLSAVEFYIEINLLDGSTVTYPENNPQLNPQRLVVKNDNKISEGIVLISPDVNFPTDSKNIVIAFSYYAIKNQISLDSIKMIFNGKDYTAKANISNTMAVLDVEKPKSGDISFSIQAKTINGNSIRSEKFTIENDSEKFTLPLNLDGNAAIYTNYSSKTDQDADKNAKLKLNLNGRKSWFNFKSKLFISSLENNNSQSINRYRLDLNVPHFKMKIGDYSPSFGSFSINSINIRGLYSELHFDKFRLKAIYGNSKRAIPGELLVDTDSVDPVYYNNDLMFQRRSLGIRTEFGHERYFNFGFSIVKNKDQIDSLDEDEYLAADGSLLVRPKDNLVFSTDTRFSFKDQRVVFGAEAAMSLLNSNIIGGAISQDSLESIAGQSIPIDPEQFEDIFVLNSSLEPFIPGISNLSYKAYLRLFMYRNLLNVSYSYVGNSFNNLSVGYLAKDLATISISDNINLLNNRLLMNFSYNISYNNLADDKEFTTNNNTMFAQIYAHPTPNSFLNFSFNNNISKNDLDGDDRYEVGSNIIGVGAGYKVSQIEFAPTKFSVSYANSISDEKINDYYNLKKNIVTLTANSDYRDMPIKSTVGYSISMDDNEYTLQGNSAYNYHSVFAKASYKLFDEKLIPIANIRVSTASGDLEFSSQMFDLGTNYKLDKLTDIYAAFGIANFAYPNDSDRDNSELDLKFSIKRKF